MLISFALLCSILITKGASVNLTYIVKKVDASKFVPLCLSQGNEIYEGVGWIYPIPKSPDKLPNITTKFVPSSSNDFDCNFSYNERCTKIWSLKSWNVIDNSSRKYDFITDRRWEEFPTILTSVDTKEFSERIELISNFRLGLSTRAADQVELLICEGWNPYTYPCYYVKININNIHLRKYLTLPKAITDTDATLDAYKAFAPIITKDEWRNFIVSFVKPGVLELIDVTTNRTVITYKDEKPLSPVYLHFRSKVPALWKVHQNEFFYTTSQQISRLGPILPIVSNKLCISLFISTCSYCKMTFFYMHKSQRIILRETHATRENEWSFIKIESEGDLPDKINIFVQTSLHNDSAKGFWAIDDIRSCQENEVKLSQLNSDVRTSQEDENISCQVIAHPKWRPKKIILNEIREFSAIEMSSNSTAISLKWAKETDFALDYFISYEANDVCIEEPYNTRRLHSNGFLVTKFTEVIIPNLIPYTRYNISISSVLHRHEKRIIADTDGTDMPTAKELPNRIQIRVTENSAEVSWDKVNCFDIYGNIIYAVEVTNRKLNFSVRYNDITGNTVKIDGLRPFTNYSLKVMTSRSSDYIKNGIKTRELGQNFQTKAGLAMAPQNLEIYASSENSISLRYDLPDEVFGVPIDIQVSRCNGLTSMKKCKSSISRITRCYLYSDKYCLTVSNLIPNIEHLLKVSLKNDGTNAFGKEAVVKGFTVPRVPGPPRNITYRVVDCDEKSEHCNLNVTWLHPLVQNGTITSFNIVLNSTESANDTKGSKNIHEILQISNESYQPQYTYQIKYLPYSKSYILYLQSVNVNLKSDWVSIPVKTADIGDHIDQSPKVVESKEDSIVFKAAPVDARLKYYWLTVIVQDYDKTKPIRKEILDNKKISDNLCHAYGDTWIANKLKVTNGTNNITVGGERKLEPSTKYCITFIVTNKYYNKEHDVVYYEKVTTNKKEETAKGSSSYLWALLIVLILVPICFLIYWYFRKRRQTSRRQLENEHDYETLPFEDNVVNNNAYDMLEHK